MIEQGKTYRKKNGRGKLKGRTVTAVSGTSVFWHKENGTRIHKTQRKAFEYWLYHGTSMYHDQRKQKDLEVNYVEFSIRDKRILKLLKEAGVKHKHHGKKLFIHKDDYRRSKSFLFGVQFGAKPEHLKKLLEEA